MLASAIVSPCGRAGENIAAVTGRARNQILEAAAMQNTRQNESVNFLAATPLPGPHNRHASILRCLAIAAIAWFVALPTRLAAQGTDSPPPKPYICCWAGYILYAPGQVPLKHPATPFTTIEAEWIVPKAAPTIDCSNSLEQLDGESIWVGLDGWSATYKDPPADGGGNDTDILQAGTETDIHCYDQNPHDAKAYFWILWDGTAYIPVTPGHATVEVPVGHLVHVRITVDTTDWQHATVFFEDKSPGGQTYTTTFQSGCLYNYCPPDPVVYATLFGNTAEWLVESTFYADKQHPNLPNTLNNFGTVQMTNMSVTDINGTVYTPDSPGSARQQLDQMSWTGSPDIDKNGNALLACAAITGGQAITLSRAPYAIVAPGQQGQLEPKPLNCDGTPPP
jgi:hypothetical protein